MIDTLFTLFVSKSIGVSLLVLTILGVRPLVLKWLNAKVAYSLWVMLPVFLLLPVCLWSFNESNLPNASMTFFADANNVLTAWSRKDGAFSSDFKRVALSLWGIGVIVSLIIYSRRYHSLLASFISFDYSIAEGIGDCDTDLNKQKIKVVSSSCVQVPAIFGLFSAYLILPKDFSQQPVQSQQMILRHELYHLKRRDHQVNFIKALFKCVFWFNPILLWADKIFEADQEVSCDLGVLQFAELLERKQYAQILFESVSASNGCTLVSQWKYQSLIMERVKMLKNTNQKKWHGWIAAGFAVSTVWLTSGMVLAKEKSREEAMPTRIIEPSYPRSAAENGIEGKVTFEFNLDQSGKPQQIVIIESEPKGIFDKEAMNALKQWSFKSSDSSNGLRYTMEFKLAGEQVLEVE